MSLQSILPTGIENHIHATMQKHSNIRRLELMWEKRLFSPIWRGKILAVLSQPLLHKIGLYPSMGGAGTSRQNGAGQ